MKNKLIKNLINIFYPLKCLICKKPLHPENIWGLCKECLHKIRINLSPYYQQYGRTIDYNHLNSPYCAIFNDSEFYFKKIWTVSKYHGVIKQSIRLFKYHKKTGPLNLFSELMKNFSRLFIDIDKIDSVVAVPIHKSKYKKRGFNQAQLMAERWAKSFNKPVIKNNLTKIKLTSDQVHLGRKERLSNLKGAFAVEDTLAFKNKIILLIDDVLTTGSTVNECAKILKEARAKQVYVLALARGK